ILRQSAQLRAARSYEDMQCNWAAPIATGCIRLTAESCGFLSCRSWYCNVNPRDSGSKDQKRHREDLLWDRESRRPEIFTIHFLPLPYVGNDRRMNRAVLFVAVRRPEAGVRDVRQR